MLTLKICQEFAMCACVIRKVVNHCKASSDSASTASKIVLKTQLRQFDKHANFVFILKNYFKSNFYMKIPNILCKCLF